MTWWHNDMMTWRRAEECAPERRLQLVTKKLSSHQQAHNYLKIPTWTTTTWLTRWYITIETTYQSHLGHGETGGVCAVSDTARCVWKRHKCNFYNKQQPTRFRCETILLQGKTTIYDASSWTHFSDDYPCEAVAFSWHACSPRDKLSKLSAAHGYPSVTANCKRYSSKSSCFYVFTTYRLHVRTNLFFHHITMPKKPSRRHVIMSSCHHVIMPLRISGHKASALWDLAWGTDWLCWETTWGRAKAIRKSGWNNHPRVRSIRRFFDSNQVPRD